MKNLKISKSHSWYLFIISVFVTACAKAPPTKPIVEPVVICTPKLIDLNGRPCWVNTTPEEGVVLNMMEHIQREKTRGILLKKAIIELSMTQDGVGVQHSASVNKVVEVHNDAISGHTSVTSLAVISTAKEAVEIKVRVKAIWRDLMTQKLYMWAIEDK
mgnify:CR=1 FL=1